MQNVLIDSHIIWNLQMGQVAKSARRSSDALLSKLGSSFHFVTHHSCFLLFAFGSFVLIPSDNSGCILCHWNIRAREFFLIILLNKKINSKYSRDILAA